MPDILVTTPKTEIALSRQEACNEIGIIGDGHWFRPFYNKPKVNKNNKIFFKENNRITGFAIILEDPQDIPEEGLECDSTGRTWKGSNRYYITFNMWYWLLTPVKHETLVRGYHYIYKHPLIQANIIKEIIRIRSNFIAEIKKLEDLIKNTDVLNSFKEYEELNTKINIAEYRFKRLNDSLAVNRHYIRMKNDRKVL